MKKIATLAFAFLMLLALAPIQQLLAATQTFNGEVSDTMCGKQHMIPGKTDAECIQECVKAGSSYALVVGSKVYKLSGKPQTIAPFAGKHVKVAGEVQGNTITVSSISE